ncbi:protein LURP-one-related 6 [Lotus japonicus]|uniref:protein LURP-one-related 6 n=1 Tax=Lotus japonicus TaxID=34305 RepID=UPI002590C122|nr:protein LURP-one-related 6 [Lotus japonicus]
MRAYKFLSLVKAKKVLISNNHHRLEKERQLEILNMNSKMAIVSKLYCSSSQTVLGVRRRPHVVNGGGFVVTDCSSKRVIFKVHGCGVHGKQEELILRDEDEEALLLMRRKGGMVEALSIYKKWKGYRVDYEGLQNLVFSLKEPNSCLARNNRIRISIEPSNKGWDFEIRGYFPDKHCSIVDTKGNVVAQVGVSKEVEKMMEIKDLYHVVVKPGIDQAFVVGVIAVLDNIYGESTYC